MLTAVRREREIRSSKVVWNFLFKYAMKRKLYAFGILLVAFVWCIEIILRPFLLKKIIDTATILDGDIFSYCVAYMCIITMGSLLTSFYLYINSRLYPKLNSEVMEDIYKHLMGRSYSFFQDSLSGNLSRKILDLYSNFEQLIRIPIEQFFIGSLRILASCYVLLNVHPLFSSILLSWSVLFVWLTYQLSKNTVEYSQKLSECYTVMGGTLSDSINNILSIKLFSGVGKELKEMSQKLDKCVKNNIVLQNYSIRINFFQGISIVLLISLMIFLLFLFRKSNLVTPGDFALVLTLTTTLIDCIYMIGRQLVEFSRVFGICSHSLDIIKEPHDITEQLGSKELLIKKGIIEFKSISFSYKSGSNVFVDFNLFIQPGQKIGVVGVSGAGKSTLIKLLLRLYSLNSGFIMIDGQDINLVTVDSLRNKISVIPQEPELFHRSILENIRFVKPNSSDQEIVSACKLARAHEFVNRLPEKYDSLVGDRGIRLSGGQRQRIAIARAILKDAPILILDEATSALDSLTEKYIQDGLTEAMREKTTIVIAHRLSTLKYMDRIIVLDDGKIIEDGTPDLLLSNIDGRFYALWDIQSGGGQNSFRNYAETYGISVKTRCSLAEEGDS